MEILLTKSQILSKIKKHLAKMNKQGNYSLFMSNDIMNKFTKDKKMETWKYLYDLCIQWDNFGFMPIETGKYLEKLISDPSIILGLHRTYTGYKKENIYDSSMIENILEEGLIMTGDVMQGVVLNDYASPNKNISPINNILNAIIMLKSRYKNSDIGFLFAIPSSMVTKDLEKIDGKELNLYNIDDLENRFFNQRLKPEFNLGFVTQEKGICNFFSKDEFLQEYKKNKQM